MIWASFKDTKALRQLYDEIIERFEHESITRNREWFNRAYITDKANWVPKFFTDLETSFYSCPQVGLNLTLDRLVAMERDLSEVIKMR